MNKKLNVGLVGFGSGGQIFHAPILASLDTYRLAKIRVTRPDHVALAQKKYPHTQLVANTYELFQDSSIDLIILTTPNLTHYPLAKEALEAGRHVVVDKPFTLTTGEAEELITLAEKKGVMLSVFQSRRFDSDFRTVQKIIQAGVLGEIKEMESRYDRFRNYLKPDAWREEAQPGSGLLYDLGSHLIDQALVLFGLPDAINADIRMQRPGAKADDNFELILHYPGLKVTLKAGMLVREPLPRFVILGMEGSFVKYGMDVQEEALKKGEVPSEDPHWGIEPEKLWGRVNTFTNGIHVSGTVESEKGDYRDYYRNVHEVITSGGTLKVTPRQAQNVIKVIELAIRSHQEKRTIVRN